MLRRSSRRVPCRALEQALHRPRAHEQPQAGGVSGVPGLYTASLTSCVVHAREPVRSGLGDAKMRATLLRHRDGFVEFDREEFADAIAAHGDAIEDAGAAHGLAVVGDNNELALLREVLNHVAVAAAVGLVEGGIGLVKDEERWRVDLAHGEDERDRGQGTLTT